MRRVDSPAWRAAEPRLSVLIPFLRDDPTVLLAMLDRETPELHDAVEVVLLDDGTGDADLTARLEAVVADLALPVRLLSSPDNLGRSRGRNRLTAEARGRHWLFLDSDMRPDSADFLQTWLALAKIDDPAVAFGGFSLDQAPHERRTAVHRAMALRSDCTPGIERARQPEKHVFTSNLLVRRDVFEVEAFDADFAGWGWEDVEWGMRVARRWPIVHIDNPATHMGLDTVETLAAKYEQSAANFARVAAKHPEVVATYPSYRAARLIRRTPGHRLARPLFKAIAMLDVLPDPARAFSLRLYRAALYAEAV